jgi:hypothetical protein
MSWIVVAIGALIAVISLVMFVAAKQVAAVLFPRLTVGTLRWATGLRLVVGVLLVIAASSTKVPMLFTILGVFVILAGLASRVGGDLTPTPHGTTVQRSHALAIGRKRPATAERWL